MNRLLPFCFLALLTTSFSFAEPFEVDISVDASCNLGEHREIWRFFGADEPNYAYMKDGEKLLGQLGALQPGNVFFRTHNLLTSGDTSPALKWGSTNIYTEDKDGNPVYDWTIVDLIFDTYLQNGVRPYVQLGFMPEALSTNPEPYKHTWRPGFEYSKVFTGWAYPPKSYEKWGELVFQWAKHCVERYGMQEVESWYWETWNEANIPYWQGTPEEYYKLHDYSVDAITRAIPNARVGGPDSAGSGGDFTRGFLEHCLRGKNYVTGETGTQLDFISFHAKGSPEWMGDHIRMGISNQLNTIDKGFAIVAEFPELMDKPIIIGESDPEGCAACQGDQFSYRNGTVYSSYTAASFARKHDLADRHGINFQGALSWSFTFEDQAYFAGFRQMASNGLALPVLNVMRMMSKMKGERIQAKSSGAVDLQEMMDSGVREAPDVAAFATRNGNQIAVMIWHYHDDDLPGEEALVELEIQNLPVQSGKLKLQHFRVDEFHSNAYDLWRRMGKPVAPNEDQYAQLEKASELTLLTGAPDSVTVNEGTLSLSIPLPRQAVSLLILE